MVGHLAAMTCSEVTKAGRLAETERICSIQVQTKEGHLAVRGFARS